MTHDETRPHRPPHVPPGRGARHGLGPEPGPRPEGAGRARRRGDPRWSRRGRWARPASRSRCSTRGPSAGGSTRPHPPALLRQRRPRLRHRQGLRHRAELQEVVRAVARGPQADLPRHQGRAQDRRPDDRHASTSGWRPCGTDYIDLFFIHGLGDHHIARRRRQPASRARSSRRRPTRSGSRARRSSSASRPTTRTAPRSSRRRPRAGSSTRSCSSTPPGSTRTRR